MLRAGADRTCATRDPGSTKAGIAKFQKTLHDAHMTDQYRQLHDAVLDIVGMINGPRRDALLLDEAGVTLDQALFPLLVLIGRFGPMGVVDLADRMGRDYTTVSRQLGRLEAKGLVTRETSQNDRRVNAAVIAPAGKVLTDRIDAARDRLLAAGFAQWSDGDVADLTRLVGRFAQAMRDAAPAAMRDAAPAAVRDALPEHTHG
jgi:DNA-binding MarR family transcriptional regulator